MKKASIISFLIGVILWYFGYNLAINQPNIHEFAPPIYSVIPFIAILLSIAIIPLINGNWWHHNFPKVSLFLGLPTVNSVLRANISMYCSLNSLFLGAYHNREVDFIGF